MRIHDIDYVEDVPRIKELLFKIADEDSVAEFHIRQINIKACFNQELSVKFKEWLKNQGYVEKFFDTGNSSYFKCKLSNNFLETEFNKYLFEDKEKKQ